jgi:hypothetical protein
MLYALGMVVAFGWAIVLGFVWSLWMVGRVADDHKERWIVSHVASKPCPMCHLEGRALVDADGVALCTSCRCSYEVVTL